MERILVVVSTLLFIPLPLVVGQAVTERLCPMLKVAADLDSKRELEDLEITFRCQETFPIELPGFGELQFKPDIVDEYHQIELDDERHERTLELVLKPKFPDCSSWELSFLQGKRRLPLKERYDRDRWWFSLEQDCIPLLPDRFKHEEWRFPHAPKSDRIEDELLIEAEGIIDEATLTRKVLLESRLFPNDPEDNRFRLVSQAELEHPFCSDSAKGTILVEWRHFPNDPKRDRQEVELTLASTCILGAITLESEAEVEFRRFPNDPQQDWKIHRFSLEAEGEKGGMTLEARAYWQRYRRPNYPTSSTNRDQFWLRLIGKGSRPQAEMRISLEWRWRKVAVKPESDRLIRAIEGQFSQELSSLAELLVAFHLKDTEYPNEPENNGLDMGILMGLKLNL